VGMSAANDLANRNPRSDRRGAEAHTVLLCAVRFMYTLKLFFQNEIMFFIYNNARNYFYQHENKK
jgi:hypothetical protein